MPNLYTITIKDHSTPFTTPLQELTGNFEQPTQALAIEEAKQFYAVQLDTVPDCIEIISVIETKP